jgi:small subunit ribosomal protein S7
MPRRARSFIRRVPAADPKFHSTRYAKFINYLMTRGKKSVAQDVFYSALEFLDDKIAKDPTIVAVKQTTTTQQAARPAKGKKAVTVDAGGVSEEADSAQKNLSATEVFDIALRNVCPILEVKGRRIGGSNYQVPMEVPEPRKTTLGMKWMIAAARSRKGVPMHQKLAGEILDAYNRLGAAFKKREDVHRMAESNRAFAHFARFGQKRK